VLHLLITMSVAVDQDGDVAPTNTDSHCDCFKWDCWSKLGLTF